MKITVPIPTTIEPTAVRFTIPILYDDDEVDEDWPGRDGSTITMTLDFATKKVRDWPEGRTGDIYLKVSDQCSTWLLDADDKVLAARLNDYVPNPVVPGQYGDYVILTVLKDGAVNGWHFDRHDVTEAFFNRDD